MKKQIITFIAIVAFTSINAQEWYLDFEDAKTLAQEKNKPIVMVFQGSGWCAPCIKLEKSIWSSDEFKAYAKEHFIMLKIDFPKSKKNKLSEKQQTHNNALAEKYNRQGYFPFVVILNKDEEILGKTSYKNIVISKENSTARSLNSLL